MTDEQIAALLRESYEPMDPERRQQLAREVGNRLDRWQAEREARRRRQRPYVMGGLAIVVVVLLIGVAWLLLSGGRSAHEPGLQRPSEAPLRTGRE